MYNYDTDSEISKIYKRIEEIKYIQTMSNCPYQNNFYEHMIEIEMEKVRRLNNINNYGYGVYTGGHVQAYSEQAREFTLDELSKYDGKNDRDAYVAVDGIVYDVTYNQAWAGGSHFGLIAGKDLTKQLESCHNKQDILSKLTRVGVLRL